MSVTIPLIGTLTATVDLAPFQFPQRNPNLGLPIFNNTAGFGHNWLDYGGGYYGLTASYCSISPWKFGGTYFDVPVQHAGCCIHGAGIFDYDQSLAAPGQFNPVLNTYPGYEGVNNTSIRSGFNQYIHTIQASGAHGPLIRYRNPFPSLAFVHQTKAFHTDQRAFFGAPYNVDGAGYIQNSAGFLALDEASFAEKCFQYTIQGITSFGGTPALNGGMYFFPDEGCGNNTLSAFGNTYKPQLIVKTGSNRSGLALSSASLYCAAVNPLNGNAIFNLSNLLGGTNPPFIYEAGSKTSGFFTTNVFFNPKLVGNNYTGGCDIAPTSLSDATDNSQIPQPRFEAILVPASGDFLMQVSGNKYFLIKGDLSGYYRLYFQGKTTAANAAISAGGSPVGYGVDLNGNVWFGGTAQYTPLLYSTFGLSWSLTISGFPSVTSNGLGCRIINRTPNWVWEG